MAPDLVALIVLQAQQHGVQHLVGQYLDNPVRDLLRRRILREHVGELTRRAIYRDAGTEVERRVAEPERPVVGVRGERLQRRPHRLRVRPQSEDLAARGPAHVHRLPGREHRERTAGGDNVPLPPVEDLEVAGGRGDDGEVSLLGDAVDSHLAPVAHVAHGHAAGAREAAQRREAGPVSHQRQPVRRQQCRGLRLGRLRVARAIALVSLENVRAVRRQ